LETEKVSEYSAPRLKKTKKIRSYKKTRLKNESSENLTRMENIQRRTKIKFSPRKNFLESSRTRKLAKTRFK
jgi:hypothetical protein